MTTRIVLFDPDVADSLHIELIREDFGYIHLPSLFRLWFAEAAIGEALSTDAENSAAPASLQVSLTEAQARLGKLAKIAQSHPLASHRPELPLWWEGIDHLIVKWRAPFDAKAHARLRLALQDESAAATECRDDAKNLENFRDLYTDNWHDLVEAAAQGKFSLVDECLLFTTRSLNFGDWRAWTQVFGLEHLPDLYFRRLDTGAPIEVAPYEEFMAGDEDITGEALLDGMAICSLNPEDIEPFEAVTAHRFQRMLIGRKGRRYGLFDPQEKRPLGETLYDELVWSQNDLDPILLARRGELWGFLDENGQVLQSCRFRQVHDAQENDQHRQGWAVREKQGIGWVDQQGRMTVPCDYDQVRAPAAPGLYLVSQDGGWGLAVDGGRLLLNCVFAEIRPLGLGPDAPAPGQDERDVFTGHWPKQSIAQWLANSPTDGILLLIEVRDANGCYVVDQAGRTIIPPGYAGFAPVLNKEAEAAHWQDSRWLEVYDHAGRQGVWNVKAADLAIPCEHGLASVLSLPGETSSWVLLADKSEDDTDDPPLFRVVDMRGQAALPGEYRWLNTETCEDNAEDLFHNNFSERDALAAAFAKRTTVFARRVEGAQTRTVVVCPGQPDQPVETALGALFAKNGEPQTARQLAMFYEKGDGFAHDPQQARHWRQQARDAAVRKLRGQTPDSIAPEDLELCRDALLDYICELYNDDGSKRARRAARAEVDFMNQQTTHWGCSETLDLVHGIALIDAAAGKPDFARGLLRLEIAADAHCAEAAYQLGRCYLFGHGVKRDPFKAHEFLTEAEKGGDRRALAELIATLVVLSSRRDIPVEQRAAFERELDYFKEKRDDEASTMSPFVPKIRATPQFSHWRPRILAALWKFMN